MLAWHDTRNTDTSAPDAGSPGGGISDISSSAVQYEELGGGTSSAAKVALAGVGLLSMVTKRNRSETSSAPQERVKAPKANV